MNQILDYTPQKGGGNGGSSDKGRVISIFAVILIFFALALIGVGVYNHFTQNKEAVDTPKPTDAQITVTQIEDTAKALIKVTHDKAIEKIIYKWTGVNEVTIKGTGETTMEETIDLPSGKNTITIKVVDSDQHFTTITQEFETINGTDIQKPVIQFATEGKKLIVTVTDDTGLAFVTYNWNNEEEERVDPEEEGQTKIDFFVEILPGENVFNISAVDVANNTRVETPKFRGVTEPVIESTNVDMGTKKVSFQVSHESGIKTIDLKVNDETFSYNSEGGEVYTVLPFNTTVQTLKDPGQNYLYLKVVSYDNTEKILEGTF